MRPVEIAEFLTGHEDVFEVSVLVAEVSFYLKEIDTVQVTVRVFLDSGRERDPYRYETSHLIHTPVQAGRYRPSGPFASSVEQALRAAIDSLTTFLHSAIREGHTPSEDWLKARED